MASSGGPFARSSTQRSYGTTDKKTVSKKHFRNTFVINNKSRNEPLLREEILDSIAKLVGEENVHFIRYFSQHNSTYNWYVTFDESFRIDNLFDREILIGNQLAQIEDPLREYDPTFIYKFRVSWLPHNFDIGTIERWFNCGDPIDIEVTEEYEKLEKFKHVKNGNFRVKIVVKKSASREYENLDGIKMINDFKCLISRLGQPPKCFLCKKEGHVKRNCELLKIRCETCKKIGHSTERCNLSRRIDNELEILVDLPEQIDELEDDANPNEPQNSRIEKNLNEEVKTLQTQNQPFSNIPSNEEDINKEKRKSRKSNKKKRGLNKSDQMENENKKEKLCDEKSEDSSEMVESEPYSSNDDDSPEDVGEIVTRISNQYSAPKGQSFQTNNIVKSKLTKKF